MNNIEMKLNKLIDTIRKDTGINSIMDAMEQLSAILLLQYFYEVILKDTPKEKNRKTFKNLFYNWDYFNNDKNKTDFLKFKDILRTLFINEKNSYIKSASWDKINSILNDIPLRIRSAKILEVLLSYMEEIEFDENLAVAYDKLLIKMTSESIASGAFYTPKVIVNAMVKAIKPSYEDSIYDPSLGSGGFLIEAQKSILDNNYQKSIQVYGRDKSPFAILLASLNLQLNNIDIKNILEDDSFVDNNDLQFDIILSNVPFGKVPDSSKYRDNYEEYFSNFETMFLKTIMKKLSLGGKSAVIVPEGLLFNSNNEFLNLRHELLTKYNLHSIVSLPSGVFLPYSAIKVSILFFDNTNIGNDIWFYEVQTDKPLTKSNKIKEQDFKEFIELFSQRVESENSCLVKKEDILNKKGLNLTIELPRKEDKLNNFKISDEIKYIKDKKEDFERLVSEFTNLVKNNKKVNLEKTITLKELFTIKSGKPLVKDKIKTEGKYPVYGGNGIMGYYDKYTHEGDNIIIGRVGAYCGNVHFIKGSVWLTSNSFSININSSIEIYLPYLAYTLRSLDLNKLARGSAQPAISYEKIKDLEISLPSYEQQVELADWFDEIQNKEKEIEESLITQKNKFSDLKNFMIISKSIGNN
ncbi:MAG: N-6 DNA methylase [Arcobacter sp.]|uniref:N-6 DNA methylase n=1 Tax=Arcobacter sp. TaxID=1872629 RepID=UPI003C77823A